MKRFLLISLLMLAAVTSAVACISPFVTRYYIYYMPQKESWTDRRDKALAKEWSQLLGTEVTVENINNLDFDYRMKTEDMSRKTDNPIIDVCFDGRHAGLLQYLRLLDACNSELNFSFDDWDYPSKEKIKSHEVNLKKYASTALRKQSGSLARQYRLMLMRCNFALRDYAACEKIWESAPKDGSVFTDIMRNLYAGTLFRTGRKTEAFAIYTEMGDYESALWCAMKSGDINNIRDFYAQNPNSAVIPFLIPELCANVQETVDAANAPEDSEGEYGWTGLTDFREINRQGAEEFISLALEAAANPKVRAPRMWLNAAALVSYYYGDIPRAVALTARAAEADGTDDDRICTEYIRTFVDAAAADDTELARTAPESILRLAVPDDIHAERMMVRLVYEVLQPRFRKAGMNNDLLFSLACANRLKTFGHKEISGYNTDYTDYYFQQLEELPVEDVVAWSRHLASGNYGLWKTLSERIMPQTDFLNDYIGTRYLRQGRWSEARSYLARVPLSFVSAQATAPYAARRDFRSIPWQTPREIVEGLPYSGTLASNPKIDFCDYMEDLEKRPAGYADDLRRAAAYFNASHRGKCWYLTSYGYSNESRAPSAPDLDFAALAEKYILRSAAEKPEQIEPLFARAFIGYDYELFSYNWESDILSINRNHRAYPLYRDLARALAAMPVAKQKKMPRLMSRCDILRRFIRLN